MAHSRSVLKTGCVLFHFYSSLWRFWRQLLDGSAGIRKSLVVYNFSLCYVSNVIIIHHEASMKKLCLILIFIIAQTLIFAQTEQKNTITQDSILTVLGSRNPLSIDFKIDEEQNDSLKITIQPFSYKDKTVRQFSLILTKEGDSYSARNVCVFTADDKKINIIEARLSNIDGSYSDDEKPVLYMKYKPGKMPFPITLTKK